MMLRVPTTVKRGTRRNLQVFECCAPLGQQTVPKRTRLDLSCKELPRWTRIQVIFVLLVAKEMKLNFSDAFLLRRWLHPGGVSAAWLAQWKSTLNVVISFLFDFWIIFDLLFWWCLEHQWLERSASTLAWTWHILRWKVAHPFSPKLHNLSPAWWRMLGKKEHLMPESARCWMAWTFPTKMKWKMWLLKKTIWKTLVLKQLLQAIAL